MNSNTTLVKVKLFFNMPFIYAKEIQIQLLLKLNAVTMLASDEIIINSNTTLVKVK